MSSHFLFTYADRLDARLHMARYGSYTGSPAVRCEYSHCLSKGPAVLDVIGAMLDELGIPCCVRQVDYEFQRDCYQMLVLGVMR